MVLELARSDMSPAENIIALGNSGTGKTHIGLGLGLAACQKGLSVGFIPPRRSSMNCWRRATRSDCSVFSASSPHKAPDHRRTRIRAVSQTGAELLFEVFSQRYERGSTVVTTNLPFDEWTSVFGSERLTGALLTG